jgi:predicted nucleic acid-binding Zn ribbon protein
VSSDDRTDEPADEPAVGRDTRRTHEPAADPTAHPDDEPATAGTHPRPTVGEEVRPVGERVDLTPPAAVARAALNRAKAAAAARGIRPGQEPRRRTPLEPPRGSPGKDGRDPRLVSDTLAALVRDRGWTQDLSVGGVIGRWRDVVGDQVADHCEPETFEDGVLTVRTDSTSWATNLKLLAPQLLRRLADDVGEGVVTEVRVLGPAGPGFKRGPRSVPGRGPRDTWG